MLLHPANEHQLLVNRRYFFGKSATGLGMAALASMLGEDAFGAEPSLLTQIAPKAKRVIYLFQNGAPSHVELFDHKPELAKRHGQPVPESFVAGKRFSTMTAKASAQKLLAPLEPFKQHGRSGATVTRACSCSSRALGPKLQCSGIAARGARGRCRRGCDGVLQRGGREVRQLCSNAEGAG